MKELGLERRDRKLELAAHAAWLYYIAQNTQEEIAAKLNVSRQTAQRLVALAVSEKLIKFRLDHPLSECIALAESLRDRFNLLLCEVVPSDGGNGDTFNGIAVCAATHLETYLLAKTPTILAFSSGRTLRSMVEQIPSMEQPQHKIVSIIGNMSHYGRAGRHEVVMHLCDRVGSQVYPVPTPVVATSIEERELLQTQRSFIAVKSLAEQAKATFVGISHIAWNAPLHQDGFISDDEVAELIELGAVGEIAGWAFCDRGVLLQKGTNTRVASVPLEQPAQRLIIGVAGGVKKAEAILAALRGKLITGLITDEAAAQAILGKIG
ncbi:sugar-binding transcriptional regulator [Aerosakkonema funiforme]|uniref:Sugar-binding transcriptional regulator n=1 Tax=Aerosakkonema funiforme FACHB-1375 TaxID=2949571 RepID=A0A926VG60_9CYAN|nr:sugar-binding transcriptional regulator [Aerosakkonema funiforme]MBD2183105.1 sugar-binding transcriptional regulator [Aerosakkonema funiforme FACHB-1375]